MVVGSAQRLGGLKVVGGLITEIRAIPPDSCPIQARIGHRSAALRKYPSGSLR